MVLFEIHQMFKGHFFNELSNTWNSIHEKVKKHWSWVEKKNVAYTEAATGDAFKEKVFLEISQTLQENTRARVSLLKKKL